MNHIHKASMSFSFQNKDRNCKQKYISGYLSKWIRFKKREENKKDKRDKRKKKEIVLNFIVIIFSKNFVKFFSLIIPLKWFNEIFSSKSTIPWILDLNCEFTDCCLIMLALTENCCNWIKMTRNSDTFSRKNVNKENVYIQKHISKLNVQNIACFSRKITYSNWKRPK